jgi:drug/metabolite transporter (DMT)-like permease
MFLQNSMLKKLLPYLSVFLLTIFWGYNWVVMKQAVQLIGPWEFGFIRNFFGALCLFVIIFLLKKRVSIKHYWDVFLIGVFQMIGFTVLVLVALVTGLASKTSVLTFTMPIWALLMAHLILKEKIFKFQWIALIVSFTGLMFILNPLHRQADFMSMLIATAAGFFWACGVIAVKKYHQKYPEVDLLLLTAWQMLLGSMPILVVILFKGITIYSVSNYLIGASIYNAVFCNALAWILWLYGVKHLPAGTVSLLSLLAPVIGSIASFIQLNEVPHLNEQIGMFLIVASIIFLIIAGIRKRAK